MNSMVITVWASTWLVVAAILLAGVRRIGRFRAGAWLVVATTALVFSRGLPLPGVAGGNRFGWQPLAVGLFAWTAGLVLARPAPTREPLRSATMT